MQDSPLLPHWLRIGDGGGKESVPVHSAVEAGPLVVPGAGVGETPRDQSPVLLVAGVTFAFPIRANADSSLGSWFMVCRTVTVLNGADVDLFQCGLDL